MTDPKLLHVRAQADELGVQYHHKNSVETIQTAINAFLESSQSGNAEPVEPLNEQPTRQVTSGVTPKVPEKPIVPLTEKQYQIQKHIEDKKRVAALIHCKVVCMNPNKREWAGEILSVGSAKLGTWKRYVPFNVEWHVPKILFDMMKEKKCTIFQKGTNERGHPTKKSVLINEYNIEVLEPLNKKQLEELRVKQAMAAGQPG